ncbi:DAPK2 kinase, partial [Calonectris borealis]|nr:DAPK2 kinase [Calonectris borealis]
MTAAECLVHPWIKPLSRKQAVNRSRSSINMKNFRKFNARRKWKVTKGVPALGGGSSPLGGSFPRGGVLSLGGGSCPCCPAPLCPQRRCESDQEEEGSHPVTLLRRRSSSCS